LQDNQYGLQPSFTDFSLTVLAPLELQVKGECNVERINQFTDGTTFTLNQKGYLQVAGWNVVDGQDMSAATESYLTLMSTDEDQAFTARIQQRVPRADVAEYYKLPTEKGLWSGIRSSANLDGVKPGKYEICIDTRIGNTCIRALSSKVIVVAPR